MMSRLLAGVVFLVSVVASVANAAILHGPVINPSNGRAYYLLEADTWQGSAAQANTLGGHLVVINDQAENDWVTATFGRFGGVSRNLWLGLSDAAKEGTFEWMTREPLTFTAWKSGEPNNSQEGANYVFIHAPGEEGVTGGGSWGNTLNTGDGGQIAFYGVVEADYLENDNLARWMGVARESYRINPWWIWPGLTVAPNDEQPSLRIWPKSTYTPSANARLNLGSKPNGSPSLQPYELVFEPTADSSVSASWSAQMAGTFSVDVSFTDIDDAGDGQDVHVLIDGVEVFSSTVNAAEGKRRITYTSPAPVQLKRFQSINVRVGNGGAGHDAVGDATRVDASVRYINTGVTHFEGTSARLRLNDAGNVVLNLGTSDLTYDAEGNLISKEAAASLEDIKSDYVRVTDGKVRKYSGTDGRLLWETPLDAGYTWATTRFKLDSHGNVLLPVRTTEGSPYLIKYAAKDGQQQWIASASDSYVTDIATDKNDDILIVEIDMFGAPRVTKLSGASGQSLWNKSISPLGAQRYDIIHYYPDKRNVWVYYLKFLFDSDNNPILFGSVNAIFTYIGGEEDAYAVKLEADTGKEFWQRIWRAPFDNGYWGALVNPQGDLILAQQGSIIRYKAPPIDDQHFTFRGHTEAMLHARVRVSDPQAKIYAEYGTDTSYGMRTPEVPVPADGAASVVLSGITAPNVYHYRLVVETSDGLAVGEDQVINVPTVPNQAPVAKEDSYIEPKASVLTQFVIDVLANDSDPEGDPLSIVSIYQGQYGTAKINGNNVVYTPGAGFSADTFSYTIADSYGARSTATVSVQAYNQYPPAVTDDVVQFSSGPVEFNVLTNDHDPEGKPLRVTGITQPANGTVTWYTDGRMKYSPAADFSGEDQFTYTVSDGVLQATGTVRVTVGVIDQPPIALDDAVQCGARGIAINVLANDSDPEGKPLTIQMANVTQPLHGSVTSEGNSRLRYTPHTGFIGIDQFTYTISDGAFSSSATVTVTVTAGTSGGTPANVLFSSGSGWPSGDSKLRSFGIPSINDQGEVAFVATYSARHGNSKILTGVFAGQSLAPFVWNNHWAPDTSGFPLPNGESFRSFKDPLLNARGDVAFQANLSKSSPQRDSGLWLKPAEGELRMVAREGDPAVGVEGGRLSTFISVGLTDSGAIQFVAKLQVGKGKVTSANALGLWMYTETGTQLLLRQGDTLQMGGAPKQVKLFAALTAATNSPGHGRLGAGQELLVRVTWNDQTQSLVSVSPSTAPQILVSTGDLAPGTNARFGIFGLPSPDTHGGFAVSATLLQANWSPSGNVSVCAFSAEGGWELLAEGSLNELPLERSQPVRNAEGKTAFIVRNSETGSDEIWSAEDGLIFRDNDQLSSDLPHSIVSLAFPSGELGRAVYLARSESSGAKRKKAAAAPIGLWAIDDAGAHHLLCEVGQRITVEGKEKTIRAIATLQAVPGSEAQLRSYNSKGQIISRITFTDGTQAILQHQLP